MKCNYEDPCHPFKKINKHALQRSDFQSDSCLRFIIESRTQHKLRCANRLGRNRRMPWKANQPKPTYLPYYNICQHSRFCNRARVKEVRHLDNPTWWPARAVRVSTFVWEFSRWIAGWSSGMYVYIYYKPRDFSACMKEGVSYLHEAQERGNNINQKTRSRAIINRQRHISFLVPGTLGERKE